MKIEKINDNQIRCTLTAADLEDLNLGLGDLAYGNDKARSLFRNMMLKARRECGFDAENAPLMIEAIPLSADSLMLVITRVDEPEELDTRFSKFTQVDPNEKNLSEPVMAGADDILDLFEKARRAVDKASAGSKGKTPAKGGKAAGTSENGADGKTRTAGKTGKDKAAPTDLIRLFIFRDLDTVMAAAAALGSSYNGSNALYKNEQGEYLLTVHKSSHTPEVFNKTCNMLSEYGRPGDCTPAFEAHLKEHEQTVIKKRALQTLASI
ncbi:MAG: adaptor protein MecA [Lachnospiraceae bacterium]|nr:adaptor protein MecA [Lachnospiraceae bacterium]